MGRVVWVMYCRREDECRVLQMLVVVGDSSKALVKVSTRYHAITANIAREASTDA